MTQLSFLGATWNTFTTRFILEILHQKKKKSYVKIFSIHSCEIMKTFVKNFLLHNMSDHSHHSSVRDSQEGLHLRDEFQR